MPPLRRYVGALIETSMPTVALAIHIQNMGPVAALGFVVPFTYFIFIILSTLRLDFWLSTFTGFVAAAELFLMAVYYHPEPGPDSIYHLAQQPDLLLAAYWPERSAFSCVANSRPVSPRPPCAIVSPICSVSTCRPRW